MPRPPSCAHFEAVLGDRQLPGPRQGPQRSDAGLGVSPRRRTARATNRRRSKPTASWRKLPSAGHIARQSLALIQRSLPKLALAGSVVCALGASYGAYRWVTSSAYFAIHSIEVEGQHSLSKAEIIDLLALPKTANIFRTDMDHLESRLEASPWIAEAHVTRKLPRGLEIQVSERQSIAAVELEGLYLLTAEGEIFKRATPATGELEGLCIITGLEREQFSKQPEKARDRLTYALDALAAYKKNPERPRIGELHFDKRGSLSLITFEDAVSIHLGSPSSKDFSDRFTAFDVAYQALSEDEHRQARAFRIADRTPSDRVTVAFAGN